LRKYVFDQTCFRSSGADPFHAIDKILVKYVDIFVLDFPIYNFKNVFCLDTHLFVKVP